MLWDWSDRPTGKGSPCNDFKMISYFLKEGVNLRGRTDLFSMGHV
jgi:hypothetical protein